MPPEKNHHGASPDDFVNLQATRPGGNLFVHDFMVENDFSGPPLTALWALQHMVFTPGVRRVLDRFSVLCSSRCLYSRDAAFCFRLLV